MSEEVRACQRRYVHVRGGTCMPEKVLACQMRYVYARGGTCMSEEVRACQRRYRTFTQQGKVIPHAAHARSGVK